MASNKRDNWATPFDFFNGLAEIFKFGLDTCADDGNYKCKKYLTRREDSLACHWLVNHDEWTWCNPPYSLKWRFIDKAIEQYARGTRSVLLLPNSTEAAWFKHLIRNADTLCLVPERVQYIPPPGVKMSGNTAGSVLGIFGEIDQRQFQALIDRGYLLLRNWR